MSDYHLMPVTGRAALAWVAETHRHLPRLQGSLFAVGVGHRGKLVGVATAGNPPRVWQGTGRFVITRCAALPNLPGAGWNPEIEAPYPAPVCTMLYRALCRAGKALGYSEAWTYTLMIEPGASLLAAGFTDMGLTADNADWSREDRPRIAAVCPGAKRRWRAVLRRDHLATPATELAA